jgi:hypothetical protein
MEDEVDGLQCKGALKNVTVPHERVLYPHEAIQFPPRPLLSQLSWFMNGYRCKPLQTAANEILKRGEENHAGNPA